MPHESQSESKLPKLSLDTWAVLLALFAVALVRFGVIPHVPW
jgi:hypothetical protein